MAIPVDLHQKMTSVVEMHSITELRSHIDKLRELDPKYEPLASHLKDLIVELDIEGVQDILSKMDS